MNLERFKEIVRIQIIAKHLRKCPSFISLAMKLFMSFVFMTESSSFSKLTISLTVSSEKFRMIGIKFLIYSTDLNFTERRSRLI